jgi:hypothetical protein
MPYSHVRLSSHVLLMMHVTHLTSECLHRLSLQDFHNFIYVLVRKLNVMIWAYFFPVKIPTFSLNPGCYSKSVSSENTVSAPAIKAVAACMASLGRSWYSLISSRAFHITPSLTSINLIFGMVKKASRSLVAKPEPLTLFTL